MTNKIYYGWRDIELAVTDIATQLYKDRWHPDYIVGIHSGGAIPAVMLAKMLGIKSYSLDVRLREGDENGCETNCWMPEDAFGYSEIFPTEGEPKKNILIVDDINDSGATLNWIKKDWQASCLPNSPEWGHIWGNNVRAAVLVNNVASSATVDYFAHEINKEENPSWIVFPWEEWYKHAA